MIPRLSPALERLLVPLVFLLWPVVASGQTPPAQIKLTLDQQSQIQDLASRLLKHADSAGCKKTCTILVANFTGESGQTSLLGMRIADELSDQLAAQAKGIQIASRQKLRQYLEKERIPSKLLEDDNAARWLATENGASVVLVGYLKIGLTDATLLVQLLDTKDFAMRNASAKTRVEEAVLKDIGNLGGLDPAEPFPDSPKDLSAELSEKPDTGATPPRCHHEDPSYTDAARRVKFKGTVVLQAALSKDGEITAVQPLTGAPFGLNQSAERAARLFKCQPAMKEGKPVAALLPVEFTFRLY